jgi:hypothetical protein
MISLKNDTAPSTAHLARITGVVELDPEVLVARADPEGCHFSGLPPSWNGSGCTGEEGDINGRFESSFVWR